MGKKSKISMKERERILVMIQNPATSLREIGRVLGRSHSSISEELRRAEMTRNTYCLSTAQVDRNIKASLKGRRTKLLEGKPLLKLVKKLLLEKKWSPEEISGRLKLEYKDHPEYHISYEAIYQYIYGIQDPGERKLYTDALRRKRKKRTSRKGVKKHRGPIANATSIHKRPEEVESREVPGHWEGDSVVGKGHQSAIGTLVERKFRYTKIIAYGNDKCSDNVARSFAKKFETIDIELKKTMTFDRGSEMAQHQLMTSLSGVPVYFADPGSPGQRGTNENTNGLIREFFPKKTDFSKVPPEALQEVEDMINTRPRKVLGFWTPNELVARFLQRKDGPPENLCTLKKRRG